MHSAIEIPPLKKHPPTEVSCTEDSYCSQIALGKCAASTVQHASHVAKPDHNDATDAAFATAMLHSVNFVSTDDSPDIRMQRSPGAAADQLPQSSQPVPPGDPLDDSPLPNCPTWDITRTERDKQVLSERRRASDGTPAMRGLSIRYGLGRKPQRSPERSPVLCFVASVVACSLERCRQELGIETTTSPVGNGANQRSDLQGCGSANSGTLSRTTRRVQPQTDEQRGKRACARGSISKAMKGLVGGAAQLC